MTRLHLSTRNLIEDLKASFWALPVAGLLVAAILATGAHALDRTHFASVGAQADGFLGAVHVDTVRQLLATLATAAAGVTGIVFSVTITTLALASQQFGPHVLRTYMQRRFVQLVLAAFVGTVLYAMLALHWLGAADHADFQPAVTAATTLALTGVDLLLLVLFVHLTATSIQVGSVIESVHEDHVSRTAILFPAADGEEEPPALDGADIDASLAAGGGTRITAADDGYLQSIDRVRLIELASSLDVRIVVAHEPGSWVMAGSTLARVHAPTGAAVPLPGEPSDTPARLEQRVRRLLVLGRSPTPEHDPRFALRQLHQIVLRALSPALNDPQTAATCIARIGAIASDLLSRDHVRRRFTDAGGTVRLIERRSTPGELLDFAFDAVIRAGASRADTASELVHTLHELAVRRPRSRWLDRLGRQLDRIESGVLNASPEPADAERLSESIRRARRRIVAGVEPGVAAGAGAGADHRASVATDAAAQLGPDNRTSAGTGSSP